MDSRLLRLGSAIDELIAERDQARKLAEGYRDTLQAHGLASETETLPWEAAWDCYGQLRLELKDD